MVLGTASHVGKSVLTAALGRILADDGYRVAPFKAQNMALNSAATPDGREIGRAQAMQAEACRIAPAAEMNPVLIKPSTDTGAQVVVLGRVWGEVTAADYHQRRVEELFPIVRESYQKLAARYDVIVMEGAGSPAEINLKARDIVNLRMAEAADAACLLVGDIDRGGVFASLLGTLELLESAERARIRGFAINKFRGDIELLKPGIAMIQERIDCRCVGVVPYLHDLGIDEEDSVALEDRRTVRRVWRDARASGEETPHRRLRIGVIALPHMANFTDFDAPAMEPSVALAFLDRPEDLIDADIVIIPGSKQTAGDLDWLRASGFAGAICERRDASRPFGIVGICGGMQMLGLVVEDPDGVENGGVPRTTQGLGLLPLRSILRGEKTTLRVAGEVAADELFGRPVKARSFRGYEIHLGETRYETGARVFANLCRSGSNDRIADGAISDDGRVFGTYVHGLFDCDDFRAAWIQAARAMSGLAPARDFVAAGAERERRFDRLAARVRQSLDIDEIKSWLRL